MPRVHHVKKARKDNPVAKKGESYYWWKFRYGGKRYSLTPPRRSQLTSSGHLAAIYEAEDAVTDVSLDTSTPDSLIATLEEVISAVESAAETFRDESEQYNESADNVEEHFPGSWKAEEIREKGEACETAADEADTLVDSLNDCKQRAEDLGDSPEGDEDAEDDEEAYEAYETKCDEWQTEFDDIVNDAENTVGDFEGPQF